MLVKPIAAAGSGCHHSACYVVLPLGQVPLSSFPRTCAQLHWPSARIAFPLKANEHRARSVCVGLGIAPGLVLGDERELLATSPKKMVSGHKRLKPFVAGGAGVIHRQLTVNYVGKQVAAKDGPLRQRMRFQFGLRREIAETVIIAVGDIEGG